MPVTIEFLFMFFLSAVLVLIFAGAILAQIDAAKAAAGSREMIGSAESIAIAVDMALNGGLDANFSEVFSVEQGKLHIEHEGKIIEVGGVFESDDAEPV